LLAVIYIYIYILFCKFQSVLD